MVDIVNNPAEQNPQDVEQNTTRTNIQTEGRPEAPNPNPAPVTEEPERLAGDDFLEPQDG